MIQLQKAVSDSKAFLVQVFDEARDGATLEGVELSEDMEYWLVTFSYWIGTTKRYKTVKMRSLDGFVLGIKNPDL